jgi:superoxide dismutase, Fe-Mn family
MAYTVPSLDYPFAALEPHIDAKTMEIHHDKHHGAYVTNLNKALESAPELAKLPIEKLVTSLSEVPESVRTAVRNNAGGHINHSFFWKLIGPNKGGTPKGKLAEAIKSKFGSFDDFKTKFEAAGAARFGSGWAWLIVNKKDELEIISTPNQDNPLMDGLKPVIGVDVWEHAYYLKYQNRRPDYLKAIWNVIDWDFAEKNYHSALK